MRKFILYLLFIFSFHFGYGQSVIGKWKTIDDISGKEKAIFEIYEKAGKIYGRVLEILDPKHRKEICSQCDGENKNKPIVGMTIMHGLKKDGNEYNSGSIMNPENGKIYRCSIVLESKDKLKIRGYILFPLLGRTQYWLRIK